MLGQPDDQLTSFSKLNLRGTLPVEIRAVRHWAAAELAPLPADLLGDILLVITELVTNAYDHGDGPTQLRLTRTHSPLTISIEVDDGNALLPILGQSRFDISSHRGNGLVLVAGLTTTWGVTPHPTNAGKTVWARFTPPLDQSEPRG